MIIHKGSVFNTDVEKLFLQEMIMEDTEYIVNGENDYVAIDNMISDTNIGLFDNDDISPKDMIDDDQDIYY